MNGEELDTRRTGGREDEEKREERKGKSEERRGWRGAVGTVRGADELIAFRAGMVFS